MTLPRRTFLRDVFNTTLSVGLLLTAAKVGFSQKSTSAQSDPEIPLEAQREPVFLFTESTFRPYLHDVFQGFNARGEIVELRLVRIDKSEMKNLLTKRARTTDTFALMFQASDELPPFTSIHKIRHPALGEFYLFLTSRKSKQGEQFYEAVINHVR
jgi:hypothetical protein